VAVRTHALAGHCTFALLLLGALSIGACVDYVQRAGSDYGDGRYLEVEETLAQREGDLQALSPPRQAQYGAYRGMSLLRLGDLDGAQHWLEFAARAERQLPGSLGPQEQAELRHALHEVRQRKETLAQAGVRADPAGPGLPPAPQGGPSSDGHPAYR
jgi:hypothetical protein